MFAVNNSIICFLFNKQVHDHNMEKENFISLRKTVLNYCLNYYKLFTLLVIGFFRKTFVKKSSGLQSSPFPFEIRSASSCGII